MAIPSPTINLQTDASGSGWGATNGITAIGGKWNESEKHRALHNEINYLELLAVFLALKSFCSDLSNIHIVVQVDNTTAVAYINGMGGTKSQDCNNLAKQLWAWCIDRNLWITAVHIPGAMNTVADFKSRHFKVETEWKLDVSVFREICAKFYLPDIDLFASRLNAQVDRYVSWFPDPGAEAVDAFSLNWNTLKFYAFPPFCLIPRCLQKIMIDQATGLMVVPYWPTQPWFSKLTQLLVDRPVILPKSKTLLSQPGTDDSHPMNSKLCLFCCRLSGNSSEREDFQKKFVMSCCNLGERPPSSSTNPAFRGGFSFVINGRWIPYERM